MENYSYSRIKCFQDCRYCYHRNYIEKDRKKLMHGMSEFGNFCHLILEKYALNELEIYDLLPYYLDNYEQNITLPLTLKMSKTFTKDFGWNYFEDGKKYFESFNGFPNISEILGVEHKFRTKFMDENFEINGKIDLIANENSGKLIIVDNKSKGKFKKNEKEEYAKQLYLYAYAVKLLYDRFPDKLVFNLFRSQDWVEFDFEMSAFEKTVDWIKREVEEIEGCYDFFPVRSGFFCDNFCSYRNNCPEKLE